MESPSPPSTEAEEEPVSSLFISSILTSKVVLPFQSIGNNYLQTLQQKIASEIEGKCIVDGFVRPGSVSVQKASTGEVHLNKVEYQVQYSCDICLPVEGMVFDCKIKVIPPKAGIHAECFVDGRPVVTVFISRDENLEHPLFQTCKENDIIRVRVIGVLFELNDKMMTVTADLI
jgi:DNA-directed RNA polymerase subunit E'/Rpb7